MGATQLRSIQMGRESTAGTAVAASTIWRGLGAMLDSREIIFPEENIGYLSPVDRSYIPKLYGELSMDEVEATFEQLPHILEAGVRTDAPAQDGAGTDYIYEYFLPTTSVNTPKSYTLEGITAQQTEELEYALVSEFNISGEMGEGLKVSADWFGRQVQNVTKTGALSAPTVEPILFQKGKLYIDDGGGTIGTTQLTSTWRSFDLSVMTGFQALFTGDGNLYFTKHQQRAPELELTLVFDHESQAVLEKTDWRNETGRLIRMIFEGAAVGTPGTTYSVKTLIIDLAGKYESFEKVGESDGMDTIEAKFKPMYLSADTLFAEITVVNELSALP